MALTIFLVLCALLFTWSLAKIGSKPAPKPPMFDSSNHPFRKG